MSGIFRGNFMSREEKVSLGANDQVNRVADNSASTSESTNRNSGSTHCSFSAIPLFKELLFDFMNTAERYRLLWGQIGFHDDESRYQFFEEFAADFVEYARSRQYDVSLQGHRPVDDSCRLQ